MLPLLALLAGCTVGPHYAGPPSAAPLAEAGAGFVRGEATATMPAPALSSWWETLGDPTLDMLEKRALSASADLAQAIGRLRQARAGLALERGNRLPKISGSALYAHVDIPGLNFGQRVTDTGSLTPEQQAAVVSGADTSDLDIYNLGFNASWEVDLFGGQRRAIEAARAQAEAARANLADAQVSLTAEVARAYVSVIDRRRRLTLAERIVADQRRMLSLLRQRYERGTASSADVERLVQQIDDTSADALPLAAERDAFLDELATLIGQEPGSVDAMTASDRPLPLPPASVAVGDPASLIRRRPDIRAAERTLAADTAKIGQAEAERFPRISFMGIIGIGGTHPSDLTKLDDFTALLAPQLSWNFLDFGRTRARVEQANGARDDAEARYRATVLTALRDAEDSLARFRYGRITVATLARARATAERSTAIARERYEAGTATLIDVIDAERQGIAAEQQLAYAESNLTGEFVAIQKALGLGWQTPQ